MAEQEPVEKSLAERWYEEQQAWQKTMRDYADSMAKDENFLMHLGNAMRGSLLAGTPYPQQPTFSDENAGPPSDEILAEVLFTLKRLEGRLRDIEASIEDLRASSPARDSNARL